MKNILIQPSADTDKNVADVSSIGACGNTGRVKRVLFGMLLPLAVLGWTQNIYASSPDAWQQLYQQTGEACLQASGVKKAKLVGAPVTFSHAVLYRINGVWPQAHMKDKKAKLYCLHPYPNGMPEIVERH